ncbi:hypothetical protein HO133_004999 [Letharia lupina]|uniref:Uncharacterized protein n=1 Tax=Letharia lupina TaxID=560253 RepID=A0A8H6C9K7_9LECA|nr:uncharacterized protein HO133_004999 [Letharia lupina]KAF6219174.1 hypothetical protein HO133_004999 [Letharia lupina]
MKTRSSSKVEYLATLAPKSLSTSLPDPNLERIPPYRRKIDVRRQLHRLVAVGGRHRSVLAAIGLFGHPLVDRGDCWSASSFQSSYQAINATIPIVIQTWNVFNPAREILYDASFTGWWQWVVDYLPGHASQQLSIAEGKNVSLAETATYIQNKLAVSICSTAQQYCVGPALRQYQNTTQCYAYLTQQTRFGEAYELSFGSHQTELAKQLSLAASLRSAASKMEGDSVSPLDRRQREMAQNLRLQDTGLEGEYDVMAPSSMMAQND